MAILKHIKSQNANYSDAIDYLLFQHDENTGKKIRDGSAVRTEKLEKTNKKILADGLEPSSSVFQTQKQELRTAIKACAAQSKNFEEFQARLLDEYHISVIEQRGRYSYLHPDRDKRITERSLGTRYGKERLEQIFLHKDPFLIFHIQSHLRLVVDL